MAVAAAVVVVCLSLLFLPSCRCEQLAPSPAVQTVELDRSGSAASATSECGVDMNGSPIPTEFCASSSQCSTCQPGNHSPAAAIDGNPATSWQSSPLSAGEQFRTVNFTLSLGQKFHVSELIFQSGSSPLPTSSVLHRSLDGENFTPLGYFFDIPSECPHFIPPGMGVVVPVVGPDGTFCVPAPDGNVSVVPLGDLLDFDLSSQSSTLATHLRLEFLAARATDDPTDPRQLFYSLSELSVFGVCPEPILPEDCAAPDAIRQVQTALPQEPDIRLLWQQLDNDPTAPPFFGAWHLDNIEIALSPDACPGVGCVSEDFSGNVSSVLDVVEGGVVQTPICGVPENGRGLYFGGPRERHALSVPVEGSTLRFDLGFSSPPPFCLGNLEVPAVELRLCPPGDGPDDSCLLLAIIAPGDCGYCLDQLSTRLQVLRELINTTLSSSIGIIIDGSLIVRVREDVMQAEADVQHYEGTLLVLEVVFGTRSSIPPSFTLPPSVVRLDEELVPSILEKLDSLRDLVSRTQEIRIDSSSLLSLLLSLEETLQEASSNASRLTNETAAILLRIQALLEQVRTGLNETVEVRIQVEGIAEIILGRQYEEISQDVETILAESTESLSLSERFLTLAEINSRLAEEIEEGFDSVVPELMGVVVLAEEVLLESGQALNSSAIATALLDEIERLLALAESLNTSNAVEVEFIRTVVENIEALFLETRLLTQNATLYLDILRVLVSELADDVERYRDQLSPYRIPEGCIGSCTAGEIHAAELDFNRTRMVNDSFYTLRFAEEFLANLIDGRPFDAITRIALRAQNLSTEALNQLSGVDTSGLLAEAQEALPRAVLLGNRSEEVQSRAEVASSRANATLERFQDLYFLFRELEGEAQNVTAVAESLRDLVGLEDEALEVGAAARNASSIIGAAVARVQRVDEGVGPLRDLIEGAAENIDIATAALDQAESQFDSIQDFLNATLEISNRINITVEQFISENNQIISEIDALIDSLAGIHDAVNRINAPARLAEDDPISYISLQSPPGRHIDDFIQFETLDLYLWPNADYQVPALIFYAGPVYFDIINTTVPEDYFWVSAEPGGIQLQWQLGSESGQLNVPNQRIDDNSQIFITRVGSKFELRFGFQVGGLMPGPSSAQVDNGSLLFRTSERTAFLLGGWPEGAELGCPASPIALSDYFPFRGQFQLFLFNGQQWGLWNVRGTSRPDFIGNGREFRRGSLGTVNIWFDPSLRPSSTSLSLDGAGYIKPRRLANIGSEYSSSGLLRDMTIFVRPNNDRDALIMYAYDTMLNLSMEVALQRSTIRLIIRGHSAGETEPMVDFTDSLSSVVRDAMLDIIFAATSPLRFQISNTIFSPPAGRFFEDLRRESLQVWFGGVREDMLQAPFVPEITNSSYYGCIDMNILRPSFMDVFGGPGDFFLTNYVTTPLQKGFAASCLDTIYARDVSLDGEGFLSYNFLQLESKPNDVSVVPVGPQTTISFTFLPLESSGVVLAGLDGASSLYAVMRDGFLEVGLIGEGEDVVLRSQGEVPLGEQHYLLINLQFTPPDDSVGDHSFYLNGVLQDMVSNFAGFTFRVSTSLGPGPNPQPVLFVGGVNEGVIAEIDDVPSFRGCLRDFSYNFGAMSFLNAALQERHPPGVTYHTCTFLNISRPPLLAVRPRPAELRTCLDPPPVELENTHGGFHKHTHLFTSNVLGLLQRAWNFTMMLKFSEDGHVATIGSQFGHGITLSIAGGQVVLSLTGPEGEQLEAASQQQIEEETFVLVAISCDVLESSGELLSCFLEVDGILAGNGSLQLPYLSASGSFVPSLPLLFGQVTGGNGSLVDSFIGCIKELAINGISAGFTDVQTNIPCYNNTEPGFGFTGISILVQSIPPPPPTVENSILLTFTPLRANGLLLLLSSNSTLVFAVGLVNGEVQVSTFNGMSATPMAITFAGSVCSNAAQLLQLNYSANSIQLTVAGSGPVNFDIPPPIAPVGDLQLSIGGTPADFEVREGSGAFEFLLSEEVDPDSLPAGFAGCVRDLSINGLLLEITDDAVEYKDLLIGFCPASG